MSPAGIESSAIACPYAPEHPRISGEIEQHEKRLDRVEVKVDELMMAVARIEGAWKTAVVLGSISGGVVAAAVAGVIELLMRGHP